MSKNEIDSEVTQDELQFQAEGEDPLEAELAALDAEDEAAKALEEDGLVESGPVEVTVSFKEVEVAERNIQVAIRSLEFKPRGKAGTYRAGGVYVLEAKEALELAQAGIANVIQDPCSLALTFPDLDVE